MAFVPVPPILPIHAEFGTKFVVVGAGSLYISVDVVSVVVNVVD